VHDDRHCGRAGPVIHHRALVGDAGRVGDERASTEPDLVRRSRGTGRVVLEVTVGELDRARRSMDVGPGHRITLANAGHPEPLLVGATDAWYATTRIGAPVGVESPVPYSEVTLSVPENATLIAYTDGLVERRGELLDIGLERLRHAALLHSNGSVEDLLTSVLTDTSFPRATDDTAILGLRWHS
jgi:hypothetical protein